MMKCAKLVLAVAAVPALSTATVADAQWLFVARKAIGRVEHMTQAPGEGTAGFDVATVMIQADARKVYATALKTIQGQPQLHITRQDDAQLSLDVTNGKEGVGLRVSQINTTVAQLLIAANMPNTPPGEMSVVLGSVMRICNEMNVKCTVGGK